MRGLSLNVQCKYPSPPGPLSPKRGEGEKDSRPVPPSPERGGGGKALLALACFLLATTAAADYPTVGSIQVIDSAANAYFDDNTKIEVIADGMTWCEGPLHVDGKLLFNDIPRNTTFQWTAADGVSIFLQPSGYTGRAFYGLEPGANGIAVSPDGILTFCEHGDRRVSILTPGGGKRTLVDAYEGKRLNSPNDLCYAADGTLYFTDPPYGLPRRENDPMRELDFCGVYKLTPAGKLSLVTDQLPRPNGIGLSPDGQTLYVAQSNPEQPNWTAFDFGDDGSVLAARELTDAAQEAETMEGLPDGLAVHGDGNLFASGPGGVYVITPAGRKIAMIRTGSRTSNCCFDESFETLYITADSRVLRVVLRR